MTCKYCGKREVKQGCVTCTNSYCQEANYYDNKARSARKKSDKAMYYALAMRAQKQAD